MNANHTFDEFAEKIVTITVGDLIQKLQIRSLTATQVLQAYIAKALIVHENFNCITEFVPFALVIFVIVLQNGLVINLRNPCRKEHKNWIIFLMCKDHCTAYLFVSRMIMTL